MIITLLLTHTAVLCEQDNALLKKNSQLHKTELMPSEQHSADTGALSTGYKGTRSPGSTIVLLTDDLSDKSGFFPL